MSSKDSGQTGIDSTAKGQSLKHSVLVPALPYIPLYVIAVVLVGMTDHDAAGTAIYWQLFIPVVAAVSILSAWSRAGDTRAEKTVFVVRQLLHWSLVLLVIWLLYSHSMQDFLNDQQIGFVIVYLLGLAAMLSGIHLDWRMGLFGAFITLSAMGIGWLEDNMLLLILVMIGALAAMLMTLVVRYRILRRRALKG